MKNKDWFSVLIVFLAIIAIGLLRSSAINHSNLIAGTPTMSGAFVFYAYLIIAVIISIVLLIIFKINSIDEMIFNKVIKIIFNLTLLIFTIPIVLLILFFLGY